MLHLLRALTPSQRSAVLASYLGWTVDAFDFFILVFVIDDIAEEFGIRRAPAHVKVTRDSANLGTRTR